MKENIKILGFAVVFTLVITITIYGTAAVINNLINGEGMTREGDGQKITISLSTYNEILKQAQYYDDELRSCQSDQNNGDEFVDSRCACIPWDAPGTPIGYLTEKQVCGIINEAK